MKRKNRKILIINQFYMSNPEEIIQNYDVTYILLYKNISAFLKPFRFMHQFLNLPFFHIWFRKNIELLVKGYDIIILHDAPAKQNNYFIKKITQSVDINTRLYLYYWNKIDSLEQLKLNSKWKILSFDWQDSKDQNLLYVGGFFDAGLQNASNSKNDFDVMFIGLNKGRFDDIRKIESALKERGIITMFKLVSNKYLFSSKYSRPKSYNDVLDLVSKSKSILDITKKGQMGLTLRPYEAIFFQKKLITNNTQIRSYDFYDNRNIFVLDGDVNFDELKKFLNSEFIDYSEKKRSQYSISAWLERIDLELELQNVNI